MKPSSLLLAAACIATLSVTGHAQEKTFTSANYVMPGCRAAINKSEPDNYQKGVCLGTIHGLGYALSILTEMREAGMKVPWGCVPREVTVGQQVRVVAAYIDARPNRLHEEFRALAWEALKDAWPCKP